MFLEHQLCSQNDGLCVNSIKVNYLVRKACMRCHRSKCPLLMAFFSLSFFRGYGRFLKFCLGIMSSAQKFHVTKVVASADWD